MNLPHLPSIPEIEVFIVQLIAVILLLIAGVRLVLDALDPIRRKLRGWRQTHSRPNAQGPTP